MGKIECSFCGVSSNELDKIIAGSDVYICNDCVEECHKIMTIENISAEFASADKEGLEDKIKEYIQTSIEKELKIYSDYVEQISDAKVSCNISFDIKEKT